MEIKDLQKLLDKNRSYEGSNGTQIENKTYDQVVKRIQELNDLLNDPDYEFTHQEALEMYDFIEMKSRLEKIFKNPVENDGYNDEMIPECD